jgi:hypothetical protein
MGLAAGQHDGGGLDTVHVSCASLHLEWSVATSRILTYYPVCMERAGRIGDPILQQSTLATPASKWIGRCDARFRASDAARARSVNLHLEMDMFCQLQKAIATYPLKLISLVAE